MIVKQCEDCERKGKKVYCNRCTLRADYFDVSSYDRSNINDQTDRGQIELRIKAYTWNDVLEYIRNNFFDNRSKNDLNINCEKDYAYIEEKHAEQVKLDSSSNAGARELEKENLMGFKVYFIDRDKLLESQTLKDRDVYDLTSV
jgi:hypothetical protein